MKRYLAITAVAVLAAMTAQAQAEQVGLDVDETYYFDYLDSVAGLKWVTVHYADNSSNTVGAGAYKWNVFEEKGGNQLNPNNDPFLTFCIDPTFIADGNARITDGLSNLPTPSSRGSDPMTPAQSEAIGKLFQVYQLQNPENLLGNAMLFGAPSSDYAAFQIAVWEIAWENNGDNAEDWGKVDSGDITFKPYGSADAIADAQDLLDLVLNSSLDPNDNLYGVDFVRNNSQDQAFITASPQSIVPLPAAAWAAMPLFGLIGANRLRRRLKA